MYTSSPNLLAVDNLTTFASAPPVIVSLPLEPVIVSSPSAALIVYPFLSSSPRVDKSILSATFEPLTVVPLTVYVSPTRPPNPGMSFKETSPNR